ncbi:MAG: hypothetical protein GY870_15990 [archaeon]|nr:hypothetical protein [archaeon]
MIFLKEYHCNLHVFLVADEVLSCLLELNERQKKTGKLIVSPQIQREFGMNDILNINAHLKYVEFLLNIFDNESDDITLGDIKRKFYDKFQTNHALLNQNFGVYRLLPLILIKEEYKNQKKELKGNVEKIKIIRDAIAHHKFSVDKSGYRFENNKGTVEFSYKEFNEFLHEIENDFYVNNIINKG